MTRETLGVKRETGYRNLSLFILTAYLVLTTQPAHAFTIIEPAIGAKLISGTTITARVVLGKDSGIVQVRYYW